VPSTDPDVSARRRARTFWIVVAAIVMLVAVVDALAPLQAEDWTPRYWLLRRGAGLRSLWSYLLHHRTIGDWVEMLLSSVPTAHALVTPMLAISVIVGAVAIAFGRIPRPRDPDGWLYVLVAAALVWVGAPRAGLVFFYRPYAAHFLAGGAAMVWLVFVYLYVDVAPGRGRAIACGLLGLVAGTGPHSVVLIAVWVLVRATRRQRAAGPVPAWRWWMVGGLVTGAVLLLTQRPYVPLRAILRGGFEHNLYKLYMFMGECGELVAVVMLLFFVLLLAARIRPPGLPGPDTKTIRFAGRAFLLAIISAFLSVISPRWGEPAMFAPVVAMTIATLALWREPLGDRRLRAVIASLAVVANALVALYAIPRYIEVHREFGERMDTIESTRAGGVARVAPYRRSVQDSWFYGDDFLTTNIRGLVAEIHGLRTIELDAPIGDLQAPAGFEFDEVFSTGERSRLLTDDLDVARSVFAEDVVARRHAGWDGNAQLELVNLQWPGRNGRTLIVERYHGDEREEYAGFAEIRPFDKNERMRLGIDLDSLDGDYPDTLIIEKGQPLPIEMVDDDLVRFSPQNSDRYVLLRCRRDECWVVFAPWVQI
jgi:hypothetical protein